MKHLAFTPSLVSLLMPVLAVLVVAIVGTICVTLLSAYVKSRLLGRVGGQSSFFVDILAKLVLGRGIRKPKFYSKNTLMSSPEQELFRRLIKALPDHYVLAQVAFSQFLYTDGGDGKDKFSTMATMKQKVADFVVCNRRFNMVAVIELDDASHDPEKDSKRDAALKEAGLKSVRWHVSRMPNTARIRWDVLGLRDAQDGEAISRWAPRPD